MDKGGSIADIVFEKIESDILTGVFKRGDIISEMKLCSMLGVSRTPVREALFRLRQEGLIEESGKGATVIGVTKKDVSDIYDVRIRLEGMASANCAATITPEKLEKLKNTLDLQSFYEEKGSADGVSKLDSEFHHLIYMYSDSKILESILGDLHRKAQRFRRLSVENSKRAHAAVLEHIGIYNAIAEGNRELAEKLTVEHIKNAKKNILNSLPSNYC